MDRVMSVEERIRRAEDIYNRRNGINTKPSTNEKKLNNVNKKKTAKKLLMQIFVCLSIYVIFYSVTNKNYIFSEEFRNEVNTFFNEKKIISRIYTKTKDYILNIFEDEDNSVNIENITENNLNEYNQDEKILVENNNQEKNETSENVNKESSSTEDNKAEINQDKKDEKIKEENIGGAIENTENSQNLDENKTENISQKKDEKLTEQQQMEKDVKEIKKNISFIAPIKGRISSSFGWRNPTTSRVPKYHTGVDIAAVEGTKIKSATDGKVILASSSGDYGNHYQIQIKDVIIVYAHCKKLYLKEGDTVKQGQEIAEVGSTGNSTGPHLHFEVRRNGKKIDPQLILVL